MTAQLRGLIALGRIRTVPEEKSDQHKYEGQRGYYVDRDTI